MQITSSTQSPSKIPFSNVCSSLTITPIDMGGPPPGKIPRVSPSLSSPPALHAKPRHLKDKSPPLVKSEAASGITITPIVMESQGGYERNILEPEQYMEVEGEEDDQYYDAEEGRWNRSR